MKITKNTIKIITIAQISSFGLFSQEVPKKDWTSELEEITQTDQIQAASKRVQDVAAAPVDVVLLRSAELKALGYRTLSDALGGIVGFRSTDIHANQFMGTRGVGSVDDPNTRILILLNGHALNSPSGGVFSNVGEDLGVPVELVDRIEVVRGPASCLYGNNAFQALVNVVTVDAAGTAASNIEAAVTAGTGGLGEIWTHGVLEAWGIKTGLMLSGFQRTGTSREYPQLADHSLPADLDREERQSALLRVQGAEWSLEGLVVSRTQHVASAPFGSLIGQPASYRNRRLGGEFRWEPTLGDIHWTLRLYGDRSSFTSEGIHDPGRTGGLSGKTVQDNPDYGLGGEIQGRIQLFQSLGLTFGTEQSRHHFDGLSIGNNTFDFIKTKIGYDIGNSYLETQWRPINSWTFVAGLQLATWKARYAENVTPESASETERDNISRVTPRLAIVWGPVDGHVIKFIYGQGFRLPTLMERYFTNFSTIVSNPTLQPEVMDNIQGIWSSRWSSKIRTQIVFGYYLPRHVIEPVGGVSSPAKYENTPLNGKGKSVEAESVVTFGKTELSGGMGWYSLTYQGVEQEGLSRWNCVFKAIHRVRAMSLAAEARYVDGYASRATATSIPANWTLRTSARLDGQAYWLQVSVEDVTNSCRQSLVGKEFYPITWMESTGRTIRGTIGLRF